MQYDFLKAFPKRMKIVGLYALLFWNSGQKAIWKQYGFDSMDEQLNIVFSVLLFIMEQTSKEENCTIDDITSFIDDINGQFYKKAMSFDDSHALADFIVNVVLSNEGKNMNFNGYDYGNMEYQSIHISYIANRIVYLDQEVRRTSYYLTDDGYNLLLGTLEVESNMKLSIQEMIFRMHLKKQSYDKALDDIKNVFSLMRAQLQKIEDTMVRIRRNTLEYKAADYTRLLQENLSTMKDTEKRFEGHREMVRARVREFEETHIDIHNLDREEEEKLRNLQDIEKYLNRTIDEQLRIINSQLDLRTLYSLEIDKIVQLSRIQRFSYRTELFDKVQEDPKCIDRMDSFFRPLFNQDPDKIFNVNKIFAVQHIRSVKEDEGLVMTEDFDEETWRAELDRQKKEKEEKYQTCLMALLSKAGQNGRTTLSEIASDEKNISIRSALISNIDIFKEVMGELIKVGIIGIEELRKEVRSDLKETPETIQLNKIILQIFDEHSGWKDVKEVRVMKIENAEPVIFKNVPAADGSYRFIRCSDVEIRVRREASI